MTTKQNPLPSKWMRRIAFVIFVIAILPTVLFGLRTYASFILLRSAYEVGSPMTSSIRPWMTLNYVAALYRVPNVALIERLGFHRKRPRTRA